MTRQGSGGEGSAIKLEHVTKSFDDHKVLDDVSIDVEDGSAFCLLGRSGTGSTSSVCCGPTPVACSCAARMSPR